MKWQDFEEVTALLKFENFAKANRYVRRQKLADFGCQLQMGQSEEETYWITAWPHLYLRTLEEPNICPVKKEKL